MLVWRPPTPSPRAPEPSIYPRIFSTVVSVMYNLFQLEFPGYPKKGSKYAFENAVWATGALIVNLLALKNELGFRNGNFELVHICSPDEYEALHPAHWDSYELRVGVWIVHDFNDIILHISCPKVCQKGEKHDAERWDKYHYTLEVRSNGVVKHPVLDQTRDSRNTRFSMN